MNLRSAWTYSKTNQIKGYDLPIDVAIKEQVETMNQLYELLKKNNIKLSIVVYPWPQTILYDKRENLLKTTWENFCKNKYSELEFSQLREAYTYNKPDTPENKLFSLGTQMVGCDVL
jgi:hypothetical protein